jgi:hypothetical protein
LSCCCHAGQIKPAQISLIDQEKQAEFFWQDAMVGGELLDDVVVITCAYLILF